MSDTSPSATTDVTSNFHTALEVWNSSSWDAIALDNCSGARSSMDPKSEYFSTRVEEMMRSKSQFSSVTEHEIVHSRGHWSEVSGLSDSSTDNEGYEEVNRENVQVFMQLMNNQQCKHHRRGKFFTEQFLWKLGRKIAEGGQAEIFEAVDLDGNVDPHTLLKVFKRGSCLLDLKKQWPCGIL